MKEHPESRRLALVGLGLVAVAVILTLAEAGLAERGFRIAAAVGLCLLGLLCFVQRIQVSAWLVRGLEVLLSSCLHRDQEQAVRERPRYRTELERQRLLLGFSRRELAHEARIPVAVLWLFSKFPQLVPRPEYLEALEKALLLPEDYFKHGGSYGPKCSLARLLHYDGLGYGRVFTMSRVKRASQREVDEILRKLEDLRWEELRKEGKVP